MSNWKGQERRDHPRVPVKKRATSIVETLVVDLSLSGALLEVPSSLPSGSRYSVRLTVEDERAVSLTGEVVRSYVHGFEKGSGGLPAVKYRAAIKFVDVSPKELELLEEVPIAVEVGAESIGLFRTEFLYLERSELPTEEEQHAHLVAAKGERVALAHLGVYARDLGGLASRAEDGAPGLGLQRQGRGKSGQFGEGCAECFSGEGVKCNLGQ